jgi:hypothetical protein
MPSKPNLQFSRSRRPLSVGTHRLILTLGMTSVALLAAHTPAWSQYQGNPGDIVVVGKSRSDWARYRDYWQQLLQKNAPPAAATSGDASTSAAGNANPDALKAELVSNLKISEMSLQPILRLNGSSQLVGKLTNGNKTAVTVASIGFEIVDSKGTLIQSGSAVPEPSTLQPGQTVSFGADLLTVEPNPSYKVRLTPSPFVIQGGV